MRLPRFTIGAMMAAVAISALDCMVILISDLAGVILMGVALHYGLYRSWGSTGPARRFWAGFEAAGAAALLSYLVALSVTDGGVHEVPLLAIALLEDFPSATVRRVVFRLETTHDLIFMLAVFELTLGLPMLLVALGGGGLAVSAGSRQDSRARVADALGITPALDHGPLADSPSSGC